MNAEVFGSLWPFAATMASVAIVAHVHQRRRRRALNARLHELRRPLQALALSWSPALRGPDQLELALAALRDLDLEVNGGVPDLQRRGLDARAAVTAAIDRAQPLAARFRRRVLMRWECGHSVADANPLLLAQALDNLIDNALRHGRGDVIVRGTLAEGRLRLAVADEGAASTTHRGRDPRHGHGMEIARSAVGGSHGRLRLVTGERGSVASLDLPLAPDR